MSMNLKRWLLVSFLVAAVFAVIATAQTDDDDDDEQPIGETVRGQSIEEVSEGVDAEEAAEELDEGADSKDESDSLGVKAFHFFPKYAEMQIPAGERVEVLVPISNANGNPTYEVALVAGHIGTLDHSRFIQNFSVQVYDRKLEAGETATVKYSVTPDALLEPMEYSFVVVAYLRTDDNNTLMVTGYNGTMLVLEPLGFDFKGTFTLLVFFGGIAAAVYYYMNNAAAAAPASRPARSASPAAKVETGTKNSAYDPDFVDASHLKFIQGKSQRKRSASPK